MASAAADSTPPPAFTDLPEEVLALTASLGLTEARDVASFAATSKRFAAVCKAAPLRLGLAVRAAASPSEEQAQARAELHALCASWPGTAELDLHGSPLEDSDVQHALSSLPSLQALHLSGCKKLTPAVAGAVAQRPQLRTVTLQRCFQLTAGALTDVLLAAARPGAKLACAALSHLALADWPERERERDGEGADPPVQLQLSMGQLRMLALHNCAKLDGRALQAIAASCPRLEVLMLGGSSFVLEEALPAGASCADSHGCSMPTAAGNAPAAEVQASFFQRAQAAVLEGMPALGSFSSCVAGVVAQLAALVQQLPELRVLELSFALPGLALALQHLVTTEPALLAGRAEPVQVWDLCTPASVAQALQWRHDVRHRYHSRSASMPAGAAITSQDATAFLAAAVNCSSGGRQTPLHSAAEEANPAQLQALLGLGALINARDRSGATPLFTACEAGHIRSVERLLGAGASATLRNSAGEAPLYIAALKGHERVVDLLLQHCQDRGISWQAQRLYDGDGWTPLMAAAVGGRTAIVLKLLTAAGQEAAELVQAANRYGQTTLHIAARKGSASLLRALVDAGGAASLLTADCDGKTAAEVAKRNGNGSAMRVLTDAGSVLRREQQRQRATVPTAERPRANDHRQQHQAQRWVGRRLQQRKGAGGGQGSGTGSH